MTIVVSDRFASKLSISRSPFLCDKKSTSNRQANSKMVRMYFSIKAFGNKNLIAEDGNYLSNKSIKE